MTIDIEVCLGQLADTTKNLTLNDGRKKLWREIITGPQSTKLKVKLVVVQANISDNLLH